MTPQHQEGSCLKLLRCPATSPFSSTPRLSPPMTFLLSLTSISFSSQEPCQRQSSPSPPAAFPASLSLIRAQGRRDVSGTGNRFAWQRLFMSKEIQEKEDKDMFGCGSSSDACGWYKESSLGDNLELCLAQVK
ncbi:uncharacterized protein LOC119336167 [Triticum dicoccoides]|uniref:uncharacterized protein LOC119336167 n=1 Tax=Triticum dicoccoides TaxID=85692 RepID=UPI001891E2E5|nr:uncharacterized protein LOC119336167 [Triticum dicoccoides]